MELPPDKVTDLDSRAKAEAERLVLEFASDLLDEAGRLEAALNSDGAVRQVTASMIRDANIVTRRGFARRRRTGKLIVARFAALGGSALLGVGASSMGTGPGQAAFASGLLIAAVAVSFEFVSEP